jgi:long-chain acyl-CoA synthetase
VCSGYWRDRDATEDALQDGWLATGDLGSVDDGFLSITGRKKDIIITSSGKNITPVNMENELRTIRWVSEAVVFGDDRPYLVALLTLDPEEAPALAEHVAAPSADLTALARDPGVRGELHRQIEEINGRFARIEQIKRFGILDRQLTQAEGDLTPTLKVKRAVAYDRFADRFAALYEDGSPDTVGAAPPADRPS